MIGLPVNAPVSTPRDADPGQPAPSLGLFVGRVSELDALSSAIAAGLAGKPNLIALAGPAGIGKTRLAEEAAGRAARAGAHVLWGRGWDDGGAPPYWPWVQAFRRLRQLADGGSPMEASALAAVGRLEAIWQSAPGPSGFHGEREQSRFLLFDAIVGGLETLAAAHPILLVFDDLQASDASSLKLLRFVVENVRQARLALMATLRHPFAGESEDTRALLGALARHAVTIPVGGLSLAESSQLLADSVGRPVPPPIASTAHSLTDGSPLYLRMLARDLPVATPDREGSAAENPAWSIPSQLAKVVDWSCRPLSASATAVLRMAAVLGPEFDVPLLRASHAAAAPGAGDAREPAAARVEPGLLEAERAGLAIRSCQGDGWRFAHGVIREVLYDRIPESERRRLHAAAATACETLDPRLRHRLEQAASHARRAVPDAEPERAVDLLTRAGRRAYRRLSYESAERHFASAREMAERSTAGDEAICRLSLALAAAQMRGTGCRAAEATLADAVARARRLEDGRLFAEAAFLLGELGPGLPRDPVRDEQTGLVLLEALDRLGREDSSIRARLLGRAAALLFEHRPDGFRRPLAEESVAMAERLGDAVTLGHVLCDLPNGLWDPTQAPQRLEWATRALHLARQCGDDALALRATLNRILTLFELGHQSVFDDDIEQLGTYARRLREPRYLWLSTHLRALRALVRGDFAACEQLAFEAHAHGEAAGDPRVDAYLALVIEVLRFLQGRLADFEPLIRANVFEGDDLSIRLGIGVLAAELDRPAEARAMLASMQGDGFAWLQKDPRAFTVMAASLCQLIAYLGDAPSARIVYDALLPLAGRFVTTQHLGAMLEAPVCLHLGSLAATFGDTVAARRHFEEALCDADRMGARPSRARVALQYGAMLTRANGPGDAARGRDLLEEARTLAEEIGMEIVGRRAARLIEAMPAASSAPATATPCAFQRGPDGVWTVTFRGITRQYPNTRGFDLLACLLARPHQPVSCADLLRACGKPTGVDQATGDAGPALDAAALQGYRARLAEVGGELEEAERWNDIGRVEALQHEQEMLEGELARAVGLGGRRRKTGSMAERARVNVRRAIAHALQQLATHRPLQQHLDRAIRTGRFCCYEPDPSAVPAWRT